MTSRLTFNVNLPDGEPESSIGVEKRDMSGFIAIGLMTSVGGYSRTQDFVLVDEQMQKND